MNKGSSYMSSEHEIVRQVCLAKDDPDAADQFLRDYMPFIRSETSRFLQHFPSAEYDDELSVAMMAFHEAITGYAKGRGAFLQYAAMLIRNRLIDYHRREKRHRGNLSMDVPAEEEDRTIGETLAGEGDHGEELILREATRAEIEAFSRKLTGFGFSLSDIADNCPRQKRTIAVCQKAMACAEKNPDIAADLLRTKRLPVARLSLENGIERKTLERHRKYIIALILICSGEFEIIRGHLKQVLKGGASK